MKYCYDPFSRWVFRVFSAMGFYLIISGLFQLGLAVIQGRFREEFLEKILLVMGAIYAFVPMYLMSLWLNRKYELLPEGILVGYFKRNPRLIPWSSVTEVAVAHVHQSERRKGEIVIRVAAGKVFDHDDNPFGLWQSNTFHWKYHRNIILIQHSEEIEAEFAEKCPLPITKLPL